MLSENRIIISGGAKKDKITPSEASFMERTTLRLLGKDYNLMCAKDERGHLGCFKPDFAPKTLPAGYPPLTFAECVDLLNRVALNDNQVRGVS